MVTSPDTFGPYYRFGCCLRLLHISSIHHQLGPMWTAVNAMFSDVKMFFFLLVVVVLSFTCAFTFLLQYGGGITARQASGHRWLRSHVNINNNVSREEPD